MLVAHGPDDQAIIAEESPPEQLQRWSQDRILRCPNCRGIVHVRGGPDKRTQLHFAHQRGECAWSTEAESVRHARGKMILAQWLREQFPQATVTLEERLPEPNRIADVFLVHPTGERRAFEFQCASLEIDEWKKRHEAYRAAGIIDTWIIGNNRREKREAFIEAIQIMAREILFLDPLVTPPRIWLRWAISRPQVMIWQNERLLASSLATGEQAPTLDGQQNRLGFGMTVVGSLSDIRINEHTRLIHPTRTTLEIRGRLLQTMSSTEEPDERQLQTYLAQRVDEQALRLVLIPLLKAYQRDPDLLRRYNYGRGTPEQAVTESDQQRVQKASAWLTGLERHGFSRDKLQALVQELPFVGAYAGFAGYIETLLMLAQRQHPAS